MRGLRGGTTRTGAVAVAVGVLAVAGASLPMGCGGGEPVQAPAAPPQAPAAPPDRALQLALDHIDLARREPNPVHEADALHTYGTMLDQRRRVDEAAEAMLSAHALYCLELVKAKPLEPPEHLDQKITTVSGQILNILNREINAAKDGSEREARITRAIQVYGRLYDADKKAGRLLQAAQLRHNMAGLAIDTKRTDDALRWIEEAIAIRRPLADRPENPVVGPLAWSLLHKGYALYKQDRLDEAWAIFNEVMHYMSKLEMHTLTKPGAQAIEHLALVARRHTALGRPEKANALWKALWNRYGSRSTYAHQELLLWHAVDIHAEAGDLPAAEEAGTGLLRLNAKRDPPRPDVEADVRIKIGEAIFKHSGDAVRALKFYEEAAAIQRTIGWELGLAWTHVHVGRIHLAAARAAQAAGRTADTATAAGRAMAQLEAAHAIFSRCGKHRNGLMYTLQEMRDVERVRGRKEAEQLRQEALDTLLQSPLPPKEELLRFPHVDQVWTNIWDTAHPAAPACRIVRDAEGWHVTDLIDPDRAERKAAFSWNWRQVQMRKLQFSLAGQMVLAGTYKLFLPVGGVAEINRAGVVYPVRTK